MESIAIIVAMASMLFGGYVLGLVRRDAQAGIQLDRAYLTGHVDGYQKAEIDSMVVRGGDFIFGKEL